MTHFRLDNRVILLTGATGYFGAAMAEGIIKSGAIVILAGRTKNKLEQLSKKLGDRAQPIVLDMVSEELCVETISWIQKTFNQLDGIVNNAYSGRVGTIDQINPNDFANACAINLTGPFQLIKAALPILEKTAKKNDGGASIVNISSMYGKVSPDPRIYGNSGQNNPIQYGVAKGGLIQMTRYLACHLADKKIRVNSISPGAFPRPNIRESAPEFLKQLEQKIPMGRIGYAHEIIGPVLFLLSSASSYVTGADISVDGGWTAW